MTLKYVTDTNILLTSPEVLERPNVEIPLVVIQELDNLKRKEGVAFEARRANRAIEASEATIKTEYKSAVENNDDLILKCAKDSGATLLTSDLALKLKARAEGVAYEDPYKCTNEVYKGYKEVRLNEVELAKMYQNQNDNLFDLYHNQYLLVQNEAGHTVDKLKWNGERLVPLKLPPSKVIRPLNDLQAFALDLLNDKDIPIKIIAGTYGSGKTVLCARMAVHHVVGRGNYNKIMLIRNPIGSGEGIGYIKGGKDLKLEPFLKPIEDNLEGGEIQLKHLMFTRQLEIEIPFYLKGQSIGASFLWFDECEDSDVKLMKLVGTRIAENSCAVFTGDWAQSEEKFKRNNGLTYLLNKTKDNPLVGAVVLDTDVRSEASKVFAELD